MNKIIERIKVELKTHYMQQAAENKIILFLKEFSRVISDGKIPHLSALNYYKRWNYFMYKDPLMVEQPWITFKAIDFLSKHLKKTNKVFEYGGGGSTLFFLNKVNEVITVEHNYEWFNMLQEKIVSTDSKWEGHLILPEKPVDTTGLQITKPTDYVSDDPDFRDATFKKYSTFICQFEDENFDLILIDGRSRTSCLFHAMPKVKVGGLLVLDNSDRKYYLQDNLIALKKKYKVLVNHIGMVPYSPHFSQTTIWQRVN